MLQTVNERTSEGISVWEIYLSKSMFHIVKPLPYKFSFIRIVVSSLSISGKLPESSLITASIWVYYVSTNKLVIFPISNYFNSIGILDGTISMPSTLHPLTIIPITCLIGIDSVAFFHIIFPFAPILSAIIINIMAKTIASTCCPCSSINVLTGITRVYQSTLSMQGTIDNRPLVYQSIIQSIALGLRYSTCQILLTNLLIIIRYYLLTLSILHYFRTEILRWRRY